MQLYAEFYVSFLSYFVCFVDKNVFDLEKGFLCVFVSVVNSGTLAAGSNLFLRCKSPPVILY